MKRRRKLATVTELGDRISVTDAAKAWRMKAPAIHAAISRGSIVAVRCKVPGSEVMLTYVPPAKPVDRRRKP